MDDTLRHIQLIQLEMLKIFDQFCKENDLHYSLYAGTLLGAVRHKAFIPWDDDLDVCIVLDIFFRIKRIHLLLASLFQNYGKIIQHSFNIQARLVCITLEFLLIFFQLIVFHLANLHVGYSNGTA